MGDEFQAVLSKERYRQLHEAQRILALAWDAGVFDDLDVPAHEVNTFGLARCKERAASLLAGQYPEVNVHVTWRARSYGGDPRPRFTIRVGLRHAGRGLRPKANMEATK